jgi:cytoskeleton protein RodZ
MAEREKLKFGIPGKENSEDLSAVKVNEADFGAYLREVRLHREIELNDVAAQLKIRLIYLEAIEEGRFKDLPGPTYAIGFVRAYAELLELNQQEVIDKFRSQTKGLHNKPKLKFPTPDFQTRVPSGTILLVSLFLAAVAYGSWYSFSTEGQKNVEIVLEVPERLTGSLEDEALPQEPPLDQTEEFIIEDTHDEWSAVSKDTSWDSQETAIQQTVLTGAIMEQTGIVYFDEYGHKYVATIGDSPLAPAFADHIPTETAQGGENYEESSLPKREVFGQEFGDVRLVIHVTEDSWIQISSSSGVTLLSRLFHPGESYRVPIEEGLALMTGNAGALQFFVDGNLTPSIGPLGAVRRGVTLDPDSLLAGTAVSP